MNESKMFAACTSAGNTDATVWLEKKPLFSKKDQPIAVKCQSRSTIGKERRKKKNTLYLHKQQKH